MKDGLKRGAAGALAAILMTGAAHAAVFDITITNDQEAGGLSITPLFTILHDGSYDSFNPGDMPDAGLETIAETGNPGVELAENAGAATGVAAAPGGFAPLPIIEPGETATVRIDAGTLADVYLTYAAMIIPSNDLFISNPDPLAYQVLAGGAFTGLADIVLTTDVIWDAGTEANDNQGAAFNTNGGTETETAEGIRLLSDFDTIDYLLGEGTPIGPITNISAALATISVAQVPLPAGLPLGLTALALLGLTRRRR